MSMPFYVSPEQVMADKAEYARKGISRGKSSIVLDCDVGSLLMAENPSTMSEVGDVSLAGHESNAIYRVQFDGSISDHTGYCVIGGASEDLSEFLRAEYRPNLPLGEALGLGKTALGRVAEGEPSIENKKLEVCVRERERAARKFVRLNSDRIGELLGS